MWKIVEIFWNIFEVFLMITMKKLICVVILIFVKFCSRILKSQPNQISSDFVMTWSLKQGIIYKGLR